MIGNDNIFEQTKEPLLPFWRKPLGIFLILVYFAVAATMVLPSIKALTPIDSFHKNIYAKTVGHDFRIFYTAGTLANDGAFGDLYNVEKFDSIWRETYNVTQEGTFHFSYPPLALLVWAPLSKLPYLVALVLWLGVSAILILRFILTLTQSYAVLAILIVSPLFLRAILTGQAGLLLTFLLAYGLYNLDKGRPLRSGISFGLLALKPHLAVALPLTLIYKKEWKVIVAGSVTILALAALSLFTFGTEAWLAFYQHFGSSVASETSSDVYSFTLWDMMMKMTGHRSLALAVHGLGAVFAIWVTLYTWKNTTNFSPRFITLFMFPAFISPYFHMYDITHFIVIYAFMAHDILTRKDKGLAPLVMLTIWILGYAIFKESFYQIPLLPIFFLIYLMSLPLIMINNSKARA